MLTGWVGTGIEVVCECPPNSQIMAYGDDIVVVSPEGSFLLVNGQLERIEFPDAPD